MSSRHFYRVVGALLLVLTTCFRAASRPIDPTQAAASVTQFLHTQARGQAHLLPPSDAALQLVYTVAQEDGTPALYVFNTGESGYVVAAADDCAYAILAYCHDGTFDPATAPENMMAWLERYAGEIARYSAAQPEVKAARAPANMDYTNPTAAPIAPLLGNIAWGQELPYNRLLPVTLSPSGRCATGCAATAIAQIMRYYRFPERGKHSYTYHYTDDFGRRVENTTNFAEHVYDWDKMPERTADYVTDEQKNAVAQLMSDVGASMNMQYGQVSGNYVEDVLPGMMRYFGYDRSAKLHFLAFYDTWDAWNARVIEELQAGRPVFLSGGDNSSSGHAFVCDGYDGNGLFHINWGWDGKSNNYFRMTALTPSDPGVGGASTGYSAHLAMICGLQPGDGTSESTSTLVGQTWRGEEVFVQNGQLGIRFKCEGSYHFYGKVGLRVERPDGMVDYYYHPTFTTLQRGYDYDGLMFDVRAEWQREGTRVFFISLEEEATQWLYMYNDQGQICSMSYHDGRFVPDRTERDAEEESLLLARSLSVATILYAGEAGHIVASVANDGIAYDGLLRLQLYDRQQHLLSTSDAVATVVPGFTETFGIDFDFALLPEADGDYYVTINYQTPQGLWRGMARQKDGSTALLPLHLYDRTDPAVADTHLRYLSVGVGTSEVGSFAPAFDSDTYAYTATVSEATAQVVVSAFPAVEAATVAGSGLVDLRRGHNIIDVVVTAVNRIDQRTYTIDILREGEPEPVASTDATLRSLTLATADGAAVVLTPAFSPEVYAYAAEVATQVEHVCVTAEAHHAAAVVDCPPTTALDYGDTVLRVLVTAEDQTTQQTYTVCIHRPEPVSPPDGLDDATLAALCVYADGSDTPLTLTPAFSPEEVDYRADVPYAVSAVTIAATPSYAEATVGGTGRFTVAEGISTYPLVVTSADGTATLTYTVTLSRPLSPEGIAPVTTTTTALPAYDLWGKPTAAHSRGIVISRGDKHIVR